MQPPFPRVPLGVTEQVIERHYGRDPVSRAVLNEVELLQLTGAMGGARRAAESLVEQAQAIRRDETRTPAARALAIRKLAQEVGERMATTLDGARQKVADVAERIASTTGAPPLPKTAHDAGIAAEIRARLAQMRPEDRRKALEASSISGDDAVIGAALHAPALVSGIAPEELALLRERYRQHRFPTEADRMRRYESALEDVDRAGRALVTFVQALADTAEGRTAEKAQAEVAATANAAAGGTA